QPRAARLLRSHYLQTAHPAETPTASADAQVLPGTSAIRSSLCIETPAIGRKHRWLFPAAATCTVRLSARPVGAPGRCTWLCYRSKNLHLPGQLPDSESRDTVASQIGAHHQLGSPGMVAPSP